MKKTILCLALAAAAALVSIQADEAQKPDAPAKAACGSKCCAAKAAAKASCCSAPSKSVAQQNGTAKGGHRL